MTRFITDNQGNVISEFTPKFSEVISEQGYYKILSILLNVVDSGTGARLRRAPSSQPWASSSVLQP